MNRPRIKYRTVIVNSVKMLRYAELLKRNGWQVGSVGTETILFYRKHLNGKCVG